MNPARASRSAIVIGGGVIGLFTAWRLRDAGFAVTLIERDRVGGSASWAGGGILSPLPPWQAPEPVWQLAAESLREYPAVIAELKEATGIDPEFLPSGLWVLDPPDLLGALAWSERSGLPVVKAVMPDIGRSGLNLPWVTQVRSPRLLQALAARLRQEDVAFREGVEICGFESSSTHTTLRTRDGAQHAADAIVLCAGAWVGGLTAGLGAPVPIHPVRGQMLRLQGEPGQLSSIVLDQDRYLIPRRDGGILVGSTLEPVGFDAGVTEDARAALLAFAHSLLPASRLMPVTAHWAGLRPATTDGIPLIAPVEGCSGLFVNTGHYRNGITLAPASARALAALLSS